MRLALLCAVLALAWRACVADMVLDEAAFVRMLRHTAERWHDAPPRLLALLRSEVDMDTFKRLGRSQYGLITAVAENGATVAVGAPRARCTNRSQGGEFDECGAVFVYEYVEKDALANEAQFEWRQSQVIYGNNGENFGASLALSIDFLMVGASSNSKCGNGVYTSSDEVTEEGAACGVRGAVYVYRRTNGAAVHGARYSPLAFLQYKSHEFDAGFGAALVIHHSALFVTQSHAVHCESLIPVKFNCRVVGALYWFEVEGVEDARVRRVAVHFGFPHDKDYGGYLGDAGTAVEPTEFGSSMVALGYLDDRLHIFVDSDDLYPKYDATEPDTRNSVYATYLAIGAPRAYVCAPPRGGGLGADVCTRSGAVYIVGISFTERLIGVVQRLSPLHYSSDPLSHENAEFGFALARADNALFVGAPRAYQASTLPDPEANQGAVYVYMRVPLRNASAGGDVAEGGVDAPHVSKWLAHLNRTERWLFAQRLTREAPVDTRVESLPVLNDVLTHFGGALAARSSVLLVGVPLDVSCGDDKFAGSLCDNAGSVRVFTRDFESLIAPDAAIHNVDTDGEFLSKEHPYERIRAIYDVMVLPNARFGSDLVALNGGITLGETSKEDITFAIGAPGFSQCRMPDDGLGEETCVLSGQSILIGQQVSSAGAAPGGDVGSDATTMTEKSSESEASEVSGDLVRILAVSAGALAILCTAIVGIACFVTTQRVRARKSARANGGNASGAGGTGASDASFGERAPSRVAGAGGRASTGTRSRAHSRGVGRSRAGSTVVEARRSRSNSRVGIQRQTSRGKLGYAHVDALRSASAMNTREYSFAPSTVATGDDLAKRTGYTSYSNNPVPRDSEYNSAGLGKPLPFGSSNAKNYSLAPSATTIPEI